MAEYVDRAKLMEKWTSAENQKRLREMTGQEVYSEALSLLNNAPAEKEKE